MKTLTKTELRFPASWASYLVNGDDSGLVASERAACVAACQRHGVSVASCASCDDYHEFSRGHDAWHEQPLAGSTMNFLFLQ